MEKKTIKDLKRGEYFTLNQIEEPQGISGMGPRRIHTRSKSLQHL